MDTQVFYVQFAISLAVYVALIRQYGLPWLDRLTREQAVIALLVPHAFRHLGLFALTQAAYIPQISEKWARTVAWGDLATQVLAFSAILLLQRRSSAGIAVAWLANIAGIIDFTLSTIASETTGLPVHLLYAGWFLPVFYLPLLAVSHFYLFRYLRK